MKRLSDYEGEEAIELWCDLADPMIEIFGDKKIANMMRAKKPKIIIAREIIKEYKKEVSEILLRIDDTPINGLNILVRFVELLNEIGNDPTIKSFFGSLAENKEEITSGSAMVNTEGKENLNISSDM